MKKIEMLINKKDYFIQKTKMGRYYNGMIKGKFWFAIQSADDHINICDEYYEEREEVYFVCRCSNERGESYCGRCYESYEEHHKAAIEEEDINEDYTGELYVENENFFQVEINDHQIPIIERNIEELKKKIDISKIMFKINEDEDKITYDYDFVVEKTPLGKRNDKRFVLIEKYEPENTILQLYARYCFANQILYCLKKLGRCNYWVDL
jgi:hypothetical protein